MRRETLWRMLLAAAFIFLLMPWAAQADWEQVGQAGFSAGGVWWTSLALDRSGRPYVAYADDYANGYKANVIRFNGTAWEQVGQAGFSSGAASFINLALGSNNIPYVVYRDDANSYKASVMRLNGTRWEQVGKAGFSAGRASWNSLAFDRSGTPHAAYMDEANGSKASVMKFVPPVLTPCTSLLLLKKR